MPELIFIYIFTLILLSSESVCWVLTLQKHIYFLRTTKNYSNYLATSSKSLYYCLYLTFFFCVLSWVISLIRISRLIIHPDIGCYLIIGSLLMTIGIHLSFIILWTIISQYICLQQQYWPRITHYIYKIITNNNISYESRYRDMYENWNRLEQQIKRDKNLLIDFLDIVPDLVWSKNENGEITYVNTAAARKLFGTDPLQVIGHDYDYFKEQAKIQGKSYTFDSLCKISDYEVMTTGKYNHYFESGEIFGNQLTLSVIKAPIFKTVNGDIEFKGIISAAHDITQSYEYYRQIDGLLSEKQFERASELFRQLKEKSERCVMNIK